MSFYKNEKKNLLCTKLSRSQKTIATVTIIASNTLITTTTTERTTVRLDEQSNGAKRGEDKKFNGPFCVISVQC